MSIHVLDWVLRCSPAKGSRRLVLIVLAEHAHDDGAHAFPSVATIASKAALSERSVQYALRSLEAGGHISRDGLGPRGTTSYRVAMSPIAPEPSMKDGSGAKYDAPSGATDCTPRNGCTPDDWPGRTRADARRAATRNGGVWGC